MLAIPPISDSVPGILASWTGVNGEVPGSSASGAVGPGAGTGAVAVVLVPFATLVPLSSASGGSFVLADRSCAVVAGVSQGASLATAANRDRRTVGSPANVRGSATRTDRLRVPGRSPSRAIESARNRWMVTAPDALDDVWAKVLLSGSS